MSEKSSKIPWQEFWSIYHQIEDPQHKLDWGRVVGFEHDPVTGKTSIYESLDHWLRNCSVENFVDFLKGAPTGIVTIYIHMLPTEEAKKLLKHFRVSDIQIIRDAYNSPRLLLPKEPETPPVLASADMTIEGKSNAR